MTKEEAIQLIENGSPIEKLPDEFKKNREVILKALESNWGDVLAWADISLQQDRDFLLKAISINGTVMFYIDKTIATDPDFMEEVEKIKSSKKTKKETLTKEEIDSVLDEYEDVFKALS